MTKHGFLSKIKSTAATMDTTKQQLDIEKKGKQHDRSSENNWQALKDDFMMNPQKVRIHDPSVHCHSIEIHLTAVHTERTGMKRKSHLRWTRMMVLLNNYRMS